MPVQICRAAVQKLTHESYEIRQRSLEQIEAKVRRALAHNEAIEFKPGDLCKQLIRWFGFQPVQSKEKVLQLISSLLRSAYGSKTIEQLGVERFNREMCKVRQLLKGQRAELLLVEEILQHLSDYKQKQQSDIEVIMTNTETLSLCDTTNRTEQELDNVIDNSVSNDGEELDYELPWSKPAIADFNAMKFIADLLTNSLATSVELQNALQHLQISMPDYPAEYMLQAPHILLKLLQLYDRHEELRCPLGDIIGTLEVFLHTLRERVRMRSKCIVYATSLSSSNSSIQACHKTQLTLNKTLHKLMQMFVQYFQTHIYVLHNEMQQILALFNICLEICNMQKLSISAAITENISKILEKLKDSWTQDEHFTLQRIKYLLLVFLLQRIAEINAVYKKHKISEHPQLEEVLHDYALSIFYPRRFECLQKFILAENTVFTDKFEHLNKYACEFSTAVTMLHAPQTFTFQEILTKSGDMILAFEKLASNRLIALVYNAITACLPQYLTNVELRETATNLLLKLLSQPDENIVSVVFQKLGTTVKQHFACLMQGESYCAGVCNGKLLAQLIIGVPLSTQLLLKLIHCAYESNASNSDVHAQIKQSCEDILSLLLKSQHLLGPENWSHMLEVVLLPVMPLLQCCTTFSDKICEPLLKLFDPDARNVPFLAILTGNTRFLFHPLAQIRNEALTRLVYILNSLANATEYVPNIMEVSDLLANDICLLQPPRDFSRIFATSSSFGGELSTLQTLLALLDSPDIEPLIRKTTLMQLNVMCQNWDMSVEMCRTGAYYFGLHALEHALQKASYQDYSDSAIPALGILSKLLFCDSEFRLELASTDNVYVLLLRGLFLYAHDIQARQDASMCLFQLLFASYLLVDAPGAGVAVPEVISAFSLPLKCQFSRQQRQPGSKWASNELGAGFSTPDQEALFLRQLVASSFCNGLSKLNQKWLNEQKQYDHDAKLHLTQRDWRLIKATNPLHNLRRFLRAMSNATAHEMLINGAISLKLQLALNDLQKTCCQWLPSELTLELFNMLNKYLQLPPGNEMDFVLFEQLLEVLDLCIELHLHDVTEAIFKTLQSDFQHAFILLLQNPDMPLRLYCKLCRTLLRLIESMQANNSKTAPANVFYANLFELLFEVATQRFTQRDLQRVRCLLALMQLISSKVILHMPDKQLHFYCKRFLQLSIALKSFTQTGAQWQRNCLELVCQLCEQMTQADQTFKLNMSFIKYLSGLCGHNDYQVRALAWCILARVARYNDADVKGSAQLINELSYLPGGFLACCLSTLLDYAEVGLVRQMAGNLFAELLPQSGDFEQVSLLIKQHAFFRSCDEALSYAELNSLLPEAFDFNLDTKLVTSEIISCFSRICIAIVRMNSSFTAELCEKSFMFKLYELLKVPVAYNSASYVVMCADICQLYAMCYEHNFLFLQRTLCRDQVWLKSFCLLFNKPYTDELHLVNVMQLLLAICKDQTGFHYFCENVAKTPAFLLQIFLLAFRISHINTALQRSGLAVLSFLLIKSQLHIKYDHITFAEILEKHYEPTELNKEQEQKENGCSSNIKTPEKTTKALRSHANMQVSTNVSTLKPAESARGACNLSPLDKSAAELIFLELYRLFSHIYTSKSCKFETSPSATKIQVCEALTMLLKVSNNAQQAANNLKFFDKILKIFNTFLEEFNSSCSTFVRRYGEAKKVSIIKNFQLLLNLILNWFSSSTAVLSSDLQALELSKILIQIWPWLAHSGELKLQTLQMCAILSEHSLTFCKQFSSVISSYSNSILQLVVKIVTCETNKVKASSSEDFPIISTGLCIVSNCCACAEGRSALVKARVLDIFDGIHPFSAKSPKLKMDILNSWLQFWEIFVRYPEGAQARNINSLCAIVNKSKANCITRLLALKILRNMSFATGNRSTLITSTDFIYTVNEVIAKNLDDPGAFCSYEEQIVVSVAIWKLISGGVKYAAMIRGTKLAKKFKILQEHLKVLEEEEQNKIAAEIAIHFDAIPFAKDLSVVLENIFIILDS